MIPKVSIFDLDGTLYDYKTANDFGISELVGFLSTELALDPSKLQKMYQDSRLISKQYSSLTAESHNIILYIFKMFEINNFPINLELVIESENIYWSAFISKIEPFEKVEEFIIDLKSVGSKMVMITDMSAKIQIRKLVALGFDKAFDIFISSDQVGGDKLTGKPFDYLFKERIERSDSKWYIGDNWWDLNFNDSGASVQRFKKGSLDQKDLESGLEILGFNTYEELRKVLGDLIE
jgi:putative hydrolase of the HAD superfamily